VVILQAAGAKTVADITTLFGVSRQTIYRALPDALAPAAGLGTAGLDGSLFLVLPAEAVV
jgi:hypothetical protein